MRPRLVFTLGTLLFLAVGSASPQAPVTVAFEVASIKPSITMDMAKMQAAMESGKMPKFGPHITQARAEYNSMSLRDLVANAYKVKPYQITGPDWLNMQRFDVAARIPEGSSSADAPRMLQSLLQERFKLTAHLDTQEHPALVLVVGKGGPKLKEVPAPEVVAFDESAPLKPGEMNIDTPDGPARMTRSADGRGAVVDMGAKGRFTQTFDGQNMHLEASSITMAGFVDMLNSMLQMGGGGGRQVVDRTGLTGHYEVAINLSMAEMMANARAMGMGGPGGGADAGPSDPSGAATIFASVQALGLKLESRKASVVQVVVDHIEKTPTEN